MSDAPDTISNRGYHAHIYYDPARTRPTAERLCAVLGQQCQVQFGGFRDEPVGPHPVANVQVIFTPEQFPARRRVADAASRRPGRTDPSTDRQLASTTTAATRCGSARRCR